MRIFFLVLLFFSHWALAQSVPTRGNAAPVGNGRLQTIPTSLMPWSPMDMNNFVIAGTTTHSTAAPFIVNVKLTCFKTSLIPYFPLVTATSELTFNFALSTSGSISVRVPGTYVGTYNRDSNPRNFLDVTRYITGPGRGGVRAGITGNLLRIEVPAPQVAFDPTNPANVPYLKDDYNFHSVFGEATIPLPPPALATRFQPHIFLIGGNPAQEMPIQSFSHLYQAPGSYSADIEVSLPAGSTDPAIAPRTADFRAGRALRTNVLDCKGALAP